MRRERDDALLERRVEAASQRLRIEHGARREAHHLPRGVDAGVCARGDRERRADPERRERRVERALDRREPRLRLEAAEAAALVGDLDGIEAAFHAC